MISPIDPADGPALRGWHAALVEAATAGRAEAAVMGYPDLEGMVAPREDRHHRLYAALEDGRTVGTLLVDLPDLENRHLAEVDVSVVPGHRRRGLGARLLEQAAEAMAEEGRTTAAGEVCVPGGWSPDDWPGAAFARSHGFDVVHEEDYQVLDLPVPEQRLAALPGATGGHRLTTWTGPCPEDLLEPYARMRTAMELDVPTGELDTEPQVWDADRVRQEDLRREGQGYTTIVSVARAASGEWAGYSLMMVPDEGEGEVYQDDTLVMRAHRGHGLGAALKRRNLEELSRQAPGAKWVRTWVDPDNAPMLAVNDLFGFRTVERMWEVQRVVT
ncbi:GNAT family N-acetyltransferase [Nocardiopsis sp. HNM0947]|uniref:GNAT family N-acetyltransferase n=1 Tax=Nocardiopsis coralli TaxID=2772213 RepID=A0ABR9PBH9_9ACTN|nr:GNAT family N-acetyltransferase [Nocardiopsis coralli]MBE3001055.1 GNAT family N-acetyltransferase [Nocardiopsis coralli]